MDNRLNMKAIWVASKLSMMAIAVAGCGGLGQGGAGSFNRGTYNGTVLPGPYVSIIVDLTVAANGSITGKGTMLNMLVRQPKA